MSAKLEQADAESERASIDVAAILIGCALCGRSVPAASLAAHGQRCFERLQRANGSLEEVKENVETADEQKEGLIAIASANPASESSPPLSPPLLPQSRQLIQSLSRCRRCTRPHANSRPTCSDVGRSSARRQARADAVATTTTRSRSSRPAHPILKRLRRAARRSARWIRTPLCCGLRLSFLLVVSHAAKMRDQLERQADDFVSERLRLEAQSQRLQMQRNDQLSAVRVEEVAARDREDRLRERQVGQEAEWLRERLKVEEEKAAEISALKEQAESAAQQLAQLSSNSRLLMDGEAEAIATGKGEVRRVELLPSDTFGGHTQEEFHFRLAESQLRRRAGGGGRFHDTTVEDVINPALLQRYHAFKERLCGQGQPVAERLTFHGTSAAAIDKIVAEGFLIGGVNVQALSDASLGRGICSSESSAFAMQYIKDGRQCLLFARACPSIDSAVQKDHTGVIQQLVCKSREWNVSHLRRSLRTRSARTSASMRRRLDERTVQLSSGVGSARSRSSIIRL